MADAPISAGFDDGSGEAPYVRVITRPATPVELEFLRQQDGQESVWPPLGCILGAAVSLFMSMLAAFLLKFLLGLISPALGSIAFWGLAIWSGAYALVAGLIIRAYFRQRREDLAILRREIAEGSLEEIRARIDHAFEAQVQYDLGSRPGLALDCGDGNRLYLLGKWLREPESYGARPCATSDESGWNGLPPPLAFPCACFRIVWFPLTDKVYRVFPEGPALKPEPFTGEWDYDFDECVRVRLQAPNSKPSRVEDSAPPS